MMRIDSLFWRDKTSRVLFCYLLAIVLGLAALPVYSQELDKVLIDYDMLFSEGLKKRGKLLNLSGKKIGDEGVKRLIVSRILKKVEKMDLRYNEITATGAELIAKIMPLPNLKVLILRHNILGDAGSLALARSSSFPGLEEMQLGWTETRDAGAKGFANSKKFPKLKKLDLRGNFLTNATKEELSKALGHLKVLKLF